MGDRSLDIILMVVSLAFTIIAMFLAGYAISGQGHQQNQICASLKRQNGYIVDALKRSEKNIPTIEYYKHHPAERARVLEELGRELDEFSIPPC